ncbi:MAG: hypothetical protein HUU46_07365 [Candidatus Hydrogenedentes bacterium]|nr:hypothetical protein [Candidatus Hydrogenedentota bacterium]
MRIMRNPEDERGVFVDRGEDGKVDEFQICEIDAAILGIVDEKGGHWLDFEQHLCPSCQQDFLIDATISDLMGRSRPFNSMIEGRVLTNDEFDADPPGPNPAFMKYFNLDADLRGPDRAFLQHYDPYERPPLE